MKKNKFSTISIVVLSVLILVLSVTYVYHFINKQAVPDECIISEQAYWLAKNGVVQSKMFTSLEQGWENRQYHFHKLPVYIAAVIFKNFGLSLYLVRGLSVLALIILMVLLYSFLQRTNNTTDNTQIIVKFLFLLLVFLYNSNLLKGAAIFRPEAMLMTTGFASFLFLFMYEHNKKSSEINLNLIISAFLAGVCMLVHLNGMSFIFAGLFLLLLKKHYKALIVFGIIAGFIGLFYFADMLSATELKAFWQQFTNDPNLESGDFKIYAPILKILGEHMRFFWNPEISVFSILFFVSLFLSFKTLRKSHNVLLTYFLGLVIGLASVAHGKVVYYGIIYYPFMSLIIVNSFYNIFIHRESIYPRIIAPLLLIIVLVFHGQIMIKETKSLFDSHKRVEQIISYMPNTNTRDYNIFANEYFFFNGIEHFNRIDIPMSFSQYSDRFLDVDSVKEKDFFNRCKKYNDKYIVFDPTNNFKIITDNIHLDTLNVNQVYFGYKIIAKTDDFAIFEQID